ncbi:hypothetical protein B0H10DRAFT_300019 [Mycena sp. CBHHK59/15]|nr:hypothetical protein B0H10DRAFT_300019 [Mycena sp. CBHHK59/15]
MSRCLNLPCDCLRSKEKKFDPAPSVLFFPLDLRISSLFRSSTGQPGLTHFSEIPLVFVFSHASRHNLWTCRELTVFRDSLPRLDDLTAPRILQHVCTLHMALALVSDSQFIRNVRGQALYSGSPQQTGVLSHSLHHRFLLPISASLSPRRPWTTFRGRSTRASTVGADATFSGYWHCQHGDLFPRGRGTCISAVGLSKYFSCCPSPRISKLNPISRIAHRPTQLKREPNRPKVPIGVPAGTRHPGHSLNFLPPWCPLNVRWLYIRNAAHRL